MEKPKKKKKFVNYAEKYFKKTKNKEAANKITMLLLIIGFFVFYKCSSAMVDDYLTKKYIGVQKTEWIDSIVMSENDYTKIRIIKATNSDVENNIYERVEILTKDGQKLFEGDWIPANKKDEVYNNSFIDTQCMFIEKRLFGKYYEKNTPIYKRILGLR